MAKNKNKILKIMFIAIIAILLLIINTNESESYYYYDRTWIRYTNAEFDNPNVNKSLFCMNKGYNYAGARYYVQYSSGSIEPYLAYLVYQHQQGNPSFTRNSVREAIWSYMGSIGEPQGHPPAITQEIQDIISEAKFGVTIRNTGTNITINKPTKDQFVDFGANGYGPFNITYPTFTNSAQQQKLIGATLKILVNGKELTWLPKSGEDFYLSETDGIKAGEKNRIKVVYEGNTYSGSYKKYAAEYTVHRTVGCYYCGMKVNQTNLGVYSLSRRSYT